MNAVSNKDQISYMYDGQGHNVIDPDLIWKDFISSVCIPNMKSLSLTFQKLWKG